MAEIANLFDVERAELLAAADQSDQGRFQPRALLSFLDVQAARKKLGGSRRDRRFQPQRDPKRGEALAIIAFANFKGGSGKTTSAVHFAQHMALSGYRVLIVDLDSQGSTTALFGIDPGQEVTQANSCTGWLGGGAAVSPSLSLHTYWPYIDLVAGGPILQHAEFALAQRSAVPSGSGPPHWAELARYLSSVQDRYDVVIVDTRPDVNILMVNALHTATGIVVPTQATMVDLSSTGEFFGFLGGYIDQTKPLIGDAAPEFAFSKVLVTRFLPSEKSQVALWNLMKARFGAALLPLPMLHTAVMGTAGVGKETIYEYEAGNDRIFVIREPADRGGGPSVLGTAGSLGEDAGGSVCMTSKPKVMDRLARLTAPPTGDAEAVPDGTNHGDGVRSASGFLPMQHAAAAGEALTARISSLEAELSAEKAERSSEHERFQAELTRLRRIAAEAGDTAGEFALLDPTAVANVLPADRLPRSFADSSFNELLEDIKANGQHDAITVRATEHGFEIASGRRRLEACRRLGIQLLARIRPLDKDAMLAIQFAENERRQDISAIERARWLAQVRETYGKQVQQLADDYKLDRTTVSLYLRLARLPEEIVQRLVDARALPMLKARRLMAGLEQDSGALARVVAALDSQLFASEVRGSKPSPDDQVEAAIRAAEGRSLPRGSDDAAAGIPNDKRVIVHRGRRVGTLIRNGASGWSGSPRRRTNAWFWQLRSASRT